MKILRMILLVILVVALTGCKEKNSLINAEGADEVVIFYGWSSYAMFSKEEKTVQAVSECFEDLSFEETDLDLDIPTMFTACFSKENEPVSQISIDQRGVFRIGGKTECYLITSGDFDYDELDKLYREGDRITGDVGYSYEKEED